MPISQYLVRIALRICALCVVLLGVADGAFAQGTYFLSGPAGPNTPYVFTGGGDGASPYAGLTIGRDGNFYGTTYGGGDSGAGAIYVIDKTTGVLSPLYSFTAGNDGQSPVAGLIQGQPGDDALYGLAYFGGVGNFGTIFKCSVITTSGHKTCALDPLTSLIPTLYSFTGDRDGGNPIGNLVQARDGSFWGTTAFEGKTLLPTTAGAAVGIAKPTLAPSVDNTLRGKATTTYAVGAVIQEAYTYSTAARSVDLTQETLAGPSSSYTAIDSGFLDAGLPDGSANAASLTMRMSSSSAVKWIRLWRQVDGGGYLLVQTAPNVSSQTNWVVTDGSTSEGTMFRCALLSSGLCDTGGSSDGLLGPQYRFFTGNTDGASPQGALLQGQGTDDALYGTTWFGGLFDKGTLFKIDPATNAFRTLYSFQGIADGGLIQGSLVQTSDGSFWGTTFVGGINGNATIFKCTLTGAAGSETCVANGAGLLPSYQFSGGIDGGKPLAGLVLSTDGSLYASTWFGTISNAGTVVRCTPATSGTSPCVVDGITHLVPTLYTFSITDGNGPNALVQAGDGSFWGTTAYGGGLDVGTLFRLSPLPVLTGPAPVVVNAASPAGTLVTLLGTVIDPANPNLFNPATTVTWAIDGVPVKTDNFTVGPLTVTAISMAATYPAGTHTVTISARDTAATAPTAVTTLSSTVEVDKLNQTVTFAKPADQTFSNGLTLTLAPTASSTLPVSLSVSGPATVSGKVVTITGVGTVTVTASQSGDGQYNAASDVVQTFAVAQGTQTITFTPPTTVPFSNGLTLTLSATSTSGLAVTLTLTSTNPPTGVASLTGNALSIGAIGSIVVTATQAGDANFKAATAAPRTITVSKGPQTITFPNPGSLLFGVLPVTLGATSSSGLAVTYTGITGPATLLNGVITITGVGNVSVTANQAGNGNFSAATPVTITFAVGKANQTIAFNTVPQQTPGTTFPLVATSTSGLAVSFAYVSGPGSVTGTTLSSTGVGTIRVRAFQAGNTLYNAAADVFQDIQVGKANQTITFNAPAAPTFGGPAVTLVASATSSLPVTFAVTSGPGTVSGNLLTATGVGTIVVTASQAGNAQYNAAPDAPQSVIAGKGNQTIMFSLTATPSVGGSPVTIAATATSSLPVTFSLVSGPGTLSGNQLTATGFGTIVVKGSQAGDANYNAAPDVTQNIGVAKGGQTITFPAVPTQTFGAAPVALGATATSGLAVTYTIVSGPGTVAGSTLTITGAGTITVKASQAGNTAFNAAPDVQQSITVNKVPLSISTVSVSRNYGLANPAFTVTYAGFVNGNGASSLTGTLTFTTSATTTSNPGTYSVTPGGLTSANYAITFVAGTLTVLDIPPVATNDAATTSTGTAVTIAVLSNDAHAVGTLTITSVTTPAHGTAAISGTSVVYTPASGYTGSDSFSYTENDGFGGTSTGTVTLTIGSAVSPLGRFVAFSKDLTWLHEGVTVTTGDVGANLSREHHGYGDHDDDDDHDGDHHDGDHHYGDDDGHDHWSGNGHGDDDDDDEVTVRIDANAVMQQTTSRVIGDTVELGSHSSIYNLVKNDLVNHGGAIHGTTLNTMAVPYLTLPTFPSISAGTTSVTVAKNTTKTLAPGKYGAIHVYGGGKLVLTGGLYQIVSLDVDQSGIVMFKAAVDLRIKASLNADTSSQIVTDPTVPSLRASQIKIFVAGANDDGGCHNRDQDSNDDEFGGEVVVNIGESAIVKANIYAPNGTVWLKSRSQGTGAFIGEHVQVGPSAKLTLDSGF